MKLQPVTRVIETKDFEQFEVNNFVLPMTCKNKMFELALTQIVSFD